MDEENTENTIVEELIDENTSYSDDSIFNITSYGSDIMFREIISMWDDGDIIKPEMQRYYVWDKKEASRFIDSILLGLPLPSIFLAKGKNNKLQLVDGFQRVMTVYSFVKKEIYEPDNSPFSLVNSDLINDKWKGKKFSQLSDDEQRRIRTSTIHAIIFEQKQPSDDTGMYQVFERLNTSGRSLKPQEIRNCVYHSEFNELLKKLNTDKNWRRIYNFDKLDVIDSRMLDVELILRMYAFAFLDSQPESKKTQINLIKYLNMFMYRNQNFKVIAKEEIQDSFSYIMNFLTTHFSTDLFRNYNDKNNSFGNKINPAIIDSIFTATFKEYKKGTLNNYSENLMEKYEELLKNKDYQIYISSRTTNISNIENRASLASKILYGSIK